MSKMVKTKALAMFLQFSQSIAKAFSQLSLGLGSAWLGSARLCAQLGCVRLGCAGLDCALLCFAGLAARLGSARISCAWLGSASLRLGRARFVFGLAGLSSGGFQAWFWTNLSHFWSFTFDFS